MAAKPTYDELVARLEAVEKKFSAQSGDLDLDALPFSRLTRKLEQIWTPPAAWVGSLQQDAIVPAARVRRDATQSIANSTITAVSFTVIEYASSGMWSSSNPTRLTIIRDGLWLVTANLDWTQVSNVGMRDAILYYNGNPSNRFAEDLRYPTGGYARHVLASAELFRAGTYIELGAYQESGGALDLQPATSQSQVLTATYLGKLFTTN